MDWRSVTFWQEQSEQRALLHWMSASASRVIRQHGQAVIALLNAGVDARTGETRAARKRLDLNEPRCWKFIDALRDHAPQRLGKISVLASSDRYVLRMVVLFICDGYSLSVLYGAAIDKAGWHVVELEVLP